MEFFLEMLLTAVLALSFSFLVAKLVSVATAGNSGVGGVNDLSSDQAEKSEIGVSDGLVTEEVSFGMKMDARVLLSQRDFRVIDENVELVDRFESEADRVDEVGEAATGNANVPAERDELVILTAEAESTAAVSPDNVIVKEMIVRRQDERNDLAGELHGDIGAEREELMLRSTEAESTGSVSPENVVTEEEIMHQGQEEQSDSTEERNACVENEEISGAVLIPESEEVRVEESNAVEQQSETEEENEEKEELIIEEDDDWEGIERSELEKAFAAAANLLEESGKAEQISAEAKMELYGLHKIATEGSCREAQPMAVMLSARAKWNAWQKLGNMSQEEAMEQYLALISKEIPGLMNTSHRVGNMPKSETSGFVPPNSGSLDDPTTLDTTSLESSKKVSGER